MKGWEREELDWGLLHQLLPAPVVGPTFTFCPSGGMQEVLKVKEDDRDGEEDDRGIGEVDRDGEGDD